MPLKGNVKPLYLVHLLQSLVDDRKTGFLKICDGGNTVKIFIKGGAIIHTASSQKEFHLSRLLRTKGLLSPEKIRSCLQSAKAKQQTLVRALLESGYISRENLIKILGHQAKEILSNVMLWKTGEFEYKDMPLTMKGELINPIRPLQVILEASRRVDEWTIIKNQIPSDRVTLKIAGKSNVRSKIKLNSREWRALSLIMDGSKSVRQLIENGGFDEFETYKMVFSLLLTGLVEIGQDGSKNEAALFEVGKIIAIYCNVMRAIHQDLETELGKRAFTILDECKAGLLPRERALFTPFDITKRAETNTQAFSEGMEGFDSPDEARTFLMHGFNSLLSGILHKELKILGPRITRRTLKEIKQILSYVKGFQKDADEKAKAVFRIENILVRFEEEMQAADR